MSFATRAFAVDAQERTFFFYRELWLFWSRFLYLLGGFTRSFRRHRQAKHVAYGLFDVVRNVFRRGCEEAFCAAHRKMLRTLRYPALTGRAAKFPAPYMPRPNAASSPTERGTPRMLSADPAPYKAASRTIGAT